MKKKVIIGLSGGVDSSVAAFLLKKKYLVEAIFMKNWDSGINLDILGNPNISDSICPQEKDYQDALKIAEQLGIKLHKVEFVEEYWDRVFTYFLDNFKNNLTPNPDIICNNEIKFNTFIKYANKFNPDFIAMGHYAKISKDCNNNLILKKSIDVDKDQTYFLSQLKQHQLQKIIFPLGNLTKNEVRKIALKENLATAHKKDSTGICFIGERKFMNFLSNYLPSQKGPMKTLDGNYIKEHQGTIYYTIGQRKNLGLGDYSSNKLPWYVIGKDLKTNTLYVGQGDDNLYLYSDSALITNLVWRKINLKINIISKMKIKAKFRYRQPDQEIRISWLGKNSVKVYYPHMIKSVTPGQVCAFYYKDICLGAGIINEVYYKNIKRLYT